MNIIKNTLIVSATTLVSRILGYVRDFMIAATLGTGPLNDAFVAAFKFANLFRSTLGEGALTSAFVPVFTKSLTEKNLRSALKIASIIQSILILTLIFLTAFVFCTMPYIVRVTTPGFAEDDSLIATTVSIARITFPYLFFISLAAFYGAILNSLGIFMPFAATSVIFNITMIVFAYYCNFGATQAHNVAYSVLMAGFLELLWMLYYARKNQVSLSLKKPSLTADTKIILKRMFHGFIGSSITQINTWIDMVIVSFVSGGMSYIYYADRLMQLPLAIVATATSTALLPSLAKHVAEKNSVAFDDNKGIALKISAFFLIPSAIFLFFFASEIVELLLQRGNFDSYSTTMTAAALRYLAIGLPAFALIKLFNSTFYAHGNTKTPVYTAFIGLFINVLISCSLLQLFGHVAIAIASTTSAWFIAIAMIIQSHLQSLYTLRIKMLLYVLKYTGSGGVSAMLCFILRKIYNMHILYCFTLSGMVYLLLCYTMEKFQKK